MAASLYFPVRQKEEKMFIPLWQHYERGAWLRQERANQNHEIPRHTRQSSSKRKDRREQAWVRMWRDWGPRTLLVGL